MGKKASLMWVDLEMTGLDPCQDRILEVAMIGTDWKLEKLVEYTAVVRVPEELMRERMVGEFWERNRESREGLMAQNQKGKKAEQVEAEILKLMEKKFEKEIYLAGNSIHQDRKFMEREWPNLTKKLHYRMLDVSAWKIYFEHELKKKFKKPEQHRALGDIEGSIEELKFYLSFVEKKGIN